MAQRYGSQELTKAYKINEREKKRQCNERILEVEYGIWFIHPVAHDNPWWHGKGSK